MIGVAVATKTHGLLSRDGLSKLPWHGCWGWWRPRRNRAAPASVGERLLVEGIAPEAELPWIGKIGSFQIPLIEIISLASWACWLCLLLQKRLLFCS